MRFENVAIAGLAYIDAPHRITSANLEEPLLPQMKKMGLNTGALAELSGIVARRWWDPGVQPSEVATLAGAKALKVSGVGKEKIGVLINTSVCKDYIEPSVACLVHGTLGLSDQCLNFDVGNACLAFLNGMQIIGNMIERGQVEFGLVVDGEGCRYVQETTIKRLVENKPNLIEFRDNFATLTLGSGAVAMVLGHSDLIPDGHRFLGGVTVAATEHNQLCRGQIDKMTTDASGLLRAGLDLAEKTWTAAEQHFDDWSADSLDEFVLHQVSATHTAKLLERLGIADDKAFKIFPEFGNIGPAALPITLAKALEAGRISKGDRVALMGIGSGLNCSMMEVVW